MGQSGKERSAADKLDRLYRASMQVASAATVDDVARAVVDGGVEGLGSWFGGIWFREGDELVLTYSVGPTIDPFRRIPVKGDAPLSLAVRGRAPVWIDGAAEYRARFAASFERVHDARHAGARTETASASVPLCVGDGVIGGVVFAFPTARTFSEHERSFLSALAHQAAHAIDRLRLLERERQQRGRMERLQEFGADLSPILTEDDVARIVVEHAVAAIGAANASFWIVDGDELVLKRHRNYGDELQRRLGRLRIDAPFPLNAAVRTGESIWLEGREAYAARYPEAEARTRAIYVPNEAIACIPLIASDRVLGALALGFETRHVFEPGEREFLALIARHAAQAFERARLHASERQEMARERFLAEAGAILAGSLDYRTTLETVAKLAVPTFAEWCFVDLVADDGWIDRVAVAQADPAKADVAAALRRRLAPNPELDAGVSRAVARAQPQVRAEVDDAEMRLIARDDAHLAALRAMDATSYVCAPLSAGGRSLGALTFSSGSRRYDERDLAFAVEVARRAALAIDNARLYEEQRVTLDRLVQLQAVTAALSEARTPEQVADAAARLGTRVVAAVSCAVWIDAGDGSLRLLTSEGTPDNLMEHFRVLPLSREDLPAIRVMRDGESIFVESEQDYERAAPGIVDTVRSHARTNAFAAVALKDGDARIGVLAFSWGSAHRFSQGERELITTVARHCEQALVRARLYEAEATARREAEVARSLAQEASRAKDDFLAMLGHELRNPLAPILTALQLMKLRGMAEGERERAVIERQATHLVRLVDDLLDVSRITRGKIELRRKHVEIADVVAHAIETVTPLIEQKGHCVSVEVAPKGLTVDGDPARLSQIVANLLANAAKYTRPGGRVEVRAVARADEVVLTVRDNGIGLPPTLLPRVFEIFVQGDRTLDRAEGGLGIGLALVRSLVELHGGRVSVHSEGQNRGAEFTVVLPLAATLQIVARAERANGSPTAQRKLRILVVDDNVDGAEMLAEYLTTSGYDVRTVYDGPSALSAAVEFKPAVALVDIGLPLMSGYEVAARLRAAEAAPLMRIVAVTGYGQVSDIERSREAGFDDHLVKPIDPAAVARLLDEVDKRCARESGAAE